MKNRKLIWQIFPSYLIVTLLALVAVAWIASHSVQSFYIDQTVRDLESRANLVRDQIAHSVAEGQRDRLDALCKRLGRESNTRITVILPDGQVAGESDEDPDQMEPHTSRGRPEIAAAFEGRPGRSIRFSRTLQRTMLYVAVPIPGDLPTSPAAVLRLSIPLTAVEAALRIIRLEIFLGAVAVAVLSALVSLLIARRMSRPLEDLRAGAEAFARGELGHALPASNIAEIDSLARSMSHMAAQLDQRIRDITGQRNEQQALLRSMVEGVLAVDTEFRLVSMNTSCARMLKVDPQQVRGRRVEESLRIPDLQRLLTGALTRGHSLEAQLVIRNGGERHLQAHSAPVRDAVGATLGAVLVLNDITHLRRLERVRRDFVANVSHELKTPITSIKAAVETLQDGALTDPTDAGRFLEMIARRANRLSAIIDDLLNLSRIEQQSEAAEIAFEMTALGPVLSAAVQVCEAKARAKETPILLRIDETLEARINPALVETALINLIDNAIKYSPAGSPVEVEASADEKEILISVRDQGEGIEAKHLDRIFERFYRVDKARSSKLGGTGLGLAIVKHIAAAHGGRVTVESVPGRGSRFQLHLPRNGRARSAE